MPKNGLSKNISTKLLIKIATLYYEEGLTQAQIAKKVNISRSQISRYLDEAKRKKIVRISIQSLDDDHADLETLVEKMFLIDECIVVSHNENERQKYRLVADALKDLLQRMLKQGDVVGIGWGQTILKTFNEITFDNSYDVSVIPMVGGLGITETEANTNSLAKIFADKVGGKNLIIHAPAFFNTIDAKKAILSDGDIQELIGYYPKVCIAILGMSDLNASSSFIRSLKLEASDIRSLREMGIVGDTNGLFLNAKGELVDNPISERMLTAPFDSVKAVKNVIGIAFGERKVDIIRSVLRSKLVNILITDEPTAMQLTKYKNL